MLSIWTYQKFCHLVWRYEALKYTRAFFFFLWVGEGPRGQQVGKKCVNIGENLLSDI